MEKEMNRNYVKRSQKDHSLSFKLQVVKEVESGEISLTQTALKYGIQAKITVREWIRKFDTFGIRKYII